MALLKQSNHFYSDIKIEIDSIPFSFCCFNENNEIVDNTHKDKKVIDFSVEVEDSDHNENENRNPLHEHRYIENETLIVNNDIIHEIALGKAILFQVSLTKNVSICHSQIYLVKEGLDITIHETLISTCLGILIKDC